MNEQKKVVLANDFGDSIHVHAIDHTHCLPECGRKGQQVLSRSNGSRLNIWQASRNAEILQEVREAPCLFGKVPHSLFASCGHVCINTEDATLVTNHASR